MKWCTSVVPWGSQAKGQAIPPGSELETAMPSRAAELGADLFVPLGQALVTGGLIAGVVVLAISALVPDFKGNLVKLWGAVGLVVATVAWLVLLGQTRRLLWAIERLAGLDLDGDQVAGEPQERVVLVNAARAQQESARRDNAERASEFARFVAALPVRGTSQRAWESELGRDTWAEYRDALIRLGWARWNSRKRDGSPNETKGWELTLPAEDVLSKISG